MDYKQTLSTTDYSIAKKLFQKQKKLQNNTKTHTHKTRIDIQNKESLKMLILQRRAGESVWIGDNIQITVLGNVNGTTRLAITAPQEINIVQEELRNMETAYAVTTKTH